MSPVFSAASLDEVSNSRTRLKWAILLGVLLGLAVLFAGVKFYYSRIDLKPLVIPPQALVAAAGVGRWSADAVEIAQLDGQGRATFVAMSAPFKADLYDVISWRIPGFEAASGGALLWVSDESRTDRAFVQRLTLPDVRDGRFVLRDHPEWRGSISRVGIMIQGPLREPVRIEGLQIEPRSAAFSMEDALSLAVAGWFRADPWNGASINFLGFTPEGERFTPVIWAAIWVVVAIAIFLMLAWRSGGVKSVAAIAAAMGLVGWFVLDLRWQLQLVDNISRGLEKPELVSNVVADHKLSGLAKQIPVGNSRIFVLSTEPDAYGPLRARYLLAPHGVHIGFRTLGQLSMLKPGDHVLVISTPERLQFDNDKKQLFSGERRISAELMASDVSFGTMFRITGVP
jgi:hypothetical protein